MAAACAGLGARACMWRWGGRAAVAMDVPVEQLPCSSCSSSVFTWMWHSVRATACKLGDASQDALHDALHDALQLATMTLTSLRHTEHILLEERVSAGFASRLSRSLAALPAKADGGLVGACLPGAELEG